MGKEYIASDSFHKLMTPMRSWGRTWTNITELEVLYKMSQGKRLCVDLGTAWGYSAFAMSLGAERVVTIDLFAHGNKTINGIVANCNASATYDEVKEKLSPYTNIEMVQGLTYELPESCQDVDLIFIDGSHTYPAVRADFNAWWPRVKQGGWFVFHDNNKVHPGTQRLVNDLAQNIGVVRHKDKEVWSLAVFEKVDGNG
jgi:predicted O-methyltransferase YrrM